MKKILFLILATFMTTGASAQGNTTHLPKPCLQRKIIKPFLANIGRCTCRTKMEMTTSR